jgi:hypothetical protein
MEWNKNTHSGHGEHVGQGSSKVAEIQLWLSLGMNDTLVLLFRLFVNIPYILQYVHERTE